MNQVSKDILGSGSKQRGQSLCFFDEFYKFMVLIWEAPEVEPGIEFKLP